MTTTSAANLAVSADFCIRLHGASQVGVKQHIFEVITGTANYDVYDGIHDSVSQAIRENTHDITDDAIKDATELEAQYQSSNTAYSRWSAPY